MSTKINEQIMLKHDLKELFSHVNMVAASSGHR